MLTRSDAEGAKTISRLKGWYYRVSQNPLIKKPVRNGLFLLRVSSTNLDCLKGQQILNVIRCIGPQTALQPFSIDVFSFARLNEQDYIALIPQLLKQSCLVAGNGHENISCDQWVIFKSRSMLEEHYAAATCFFLKTIGVFGLRPSRRSTNSFMISNIVELTARTRMARVHAT